MKIDKCGLALALAVLLAGCGGGDASVDSPPVGAPSAAQVTYGPDADTPALEDPVPQPNGCNVQAPALAGMHIVVAHAGVSYGMDSSETYAETVDATLVYPGFDYDKRFSLALGESLTTSYGNVVTFAARETVTVPAGTFLTCRYEEVLPDSAPPWMEPAKLTTWFVVGYGLSVKSRFTGFLYLKEDEAVLITVNGRRL